MSALFRSSLQDSVQTLGNGVNNQVLIDSTVALGTDQFCTLVDTAVEFGLTDLHLVIPILNHESEVPYRFLTVLSFQVSREPLPGMLRQLPAELTVADAIDADIQVPWVDTNVVSMTPSGTRATMIGTLVLRSGASFADVPGFEEARPLLVVR